MSTLDAITAATARELLLRRAWRKEGDVAEERDKAQALLDVVDALGAVPYMLIGGVAVGIHAGVARATEDVDLAIPSGSNVAAVRRALVAAGFREVGVFAHSINFRHPNGEPVQLALDPGFDAMIARCERFDVRGKAVAIVSREDLVAMKERAGADPARRASKRLRDQADVALLRGDVPDPDEGW